MFNHIWEVCRCLAVVLDWKSHPSCPVHGAQECERERNDLGNHPTSGPTLITSLGKPSTEEKWGRDPEEWEVLCFTGSLSCWSMLMMKAPLGVQVRIHLPTYHAGAVLITLINLV